jgi:hypothetical protein
VFFIPCRSDAREHELASQRAIARQLAQLIGGRFAGDATAQAGPLPAQGYVVPNDTIMSVEAALRLGIHSEEDLFGGVVPFPFVATKSITHPLVDSRADAPPGWSAEFCRRVAQAALPGLAAFSARDAYQAGQRLLREGPVRLKLAEGRGGAGQAVARDDAELRAHLSRFDMQGRIRDGMVLEANLAEVRTHSIGCVRVGSLEACYFGVQRTTRSRRGEDVYGGSSLTVVRGGFDELSRRVGAERADVRHAIDLARTYHAAALSCYAGLFASRCNYDVAQGLDAAGRERTGVLESSWRIGGASGAEVLALQALHSDPTLASACASTVEIHGSDVPVPQDAIVHFAGVDAVLGPITKYAKASLHEEP